MYEEVEKRQTGLLLEKKIIYLKRNGHSGPIKLQQTRGNGEEERASRKREKGEYLFPRLSAGGEGLPLRAGKKNQKGNI